MVAILLRAILLLTPLAVLLVWLKWRADSEKNPETLERDVKNLIKRIAVLLGVVLVQP